MRKRRGESGHTLIEVLVATLVMTVLGTGLWTLIRSTYDSQYEILGQNTANTYSRQAVDEIADDLRGAKGVTGATYSTVTFTDNSGATIKYFLAGGELRKTINGAPINGETVVPDVQSVAFVYWTNSTGGWVSTSAPSTPANVKAIDFTVKSTVNGSTRMTSGSVRIRQKP